MATRLHPRIFVLAGVNGAGKSSIGGSALRRNSSNYFNPDEEARFILTADPTISQAEANSTAWTQGVENLRHAISDRTDFAFETTLGGNTIPNLLKQAADKGIEVHIWFAGLSSPELHIERVRVRVKKGGHDIPEADIRRRYENSRKNLIALLPHLTALRVYDNSAEADPSKGKEPRPVLLLRIDRRKVRSFCPVEKAPAWAKPIIAAALKFKSR